MSLKNALSAKLAISSLVYSTDSGRMCPACRQPVAACVCHVKPVPKGDGVVRVGRETKGRGGKAVTLVKGLALDEAALQAVGKQLKAACGSGGTVKDGVFEVLDNLRDKAVTHFRLSPLGIISTDRCTG